MVKVKNLPHKYKEGASQISDTYSHTKFSVGSLPCPTKSFIASDLMQGNQNLNLSSLFLCYLRERNLGASGNVN